MPLNEGSTMSTKTVATYLDDVGRMLAGVDPAYRSEVLAGVRDHLETTLGAEPWSEADVHRALVQLGPPEEIATAALDSPPPPAAERRPPSMARAWVPAVAVTGLALGLAPMLFIFSQFVAFFSGLGDEVFATLAEPWSAVRSLAWLLFFPPTLLVIAGAILVTISPLYRTVDRVAAWLVLPWCAVIIELTSMIVRASDLCARTGTSTCGSVDPLTARMAQISAVAVAGIGVLLLLIRLGRARSMAHADVTRWWTATAVVLGLLTSALPIVLLPLTYRQGAYVSFGVEGVVAYPWTFGATLMPVLVVTPVWILTVVLMVRSRLWKAWAQAIGIAVAPILLAAVTAVTVVPSSLSPAVQTVGTVVAIAGAAAVTATATALFLTGVKAGRD